MMRPAPPSHHPHKLWVGSSRHGVSGDFIKSGFESFGFSDVSHVVVRHVGSVDRGQTLDSIAFVEFISAKLYVFSLLGLFATVLLEIICVRH